MKNLTLTILLALAPLSWGYTFDDGTKFEGDFESYIFLKCRHEKPLSFTLDGEEPFLMFFSILVDEELAYSVDNNTKAWSALYPTVEANKITFRSFPSFSVGGVTDSVATLNRTTLRTYHQQQGWLSCDFTDYEFIDSWLAKIRAQRRI
jgi:hypothetical protein